MSAWQPIDTMPTREMAGLFPVIIGAFWQPKDDDGEPVGPMELTWAHVVYRSGSGWMLNSSGFRSLHGNASFAVGGNETHWMPLAQTVAA